MLHNEEDVEKMELCNAAKENQKSLLKDYTEMIASPK